MASRALIALIAVITIATACTSTSGDGSTSTISGSSDGGTTTNSNGPDPAGEDTTGELGCRIDVHTHLDGQYRGDDGPVRDFAAAVATLTEQATATGLTDVIVMPPPISADPNQAGTYTAADLIDGLDGPSSGDPAIHLSAGGGTLGPLLNAATGEMSDAELDAFEQLAREVAGGDPAPVGYGELAALHLSFNPNHPAIEIAPDTPLFLRLSEVAAELALPIDLHMEAVEEDLPTPDSFAVPPNAATLTANIDALERLLDHAPATIVWSHPGWDNTGDLTPQLVDSLLDRHDTSWSPSNRPSVTGPATLSSSTESPIRAGSR